MWKMSAKICMNIKDKNWLVSLKKRMIKSKKDREPQNDPEALLHGVDPVRQVIQWENTSRQHVVTQRKIQHPLEVVLKNTKILGQRTHTSWLTAVVLVF